MKVQFVQIFTYVVPCTLSKIPIKCCDVIALKLVEVEQILENYLSIGYIQMIRLACCCKCLKSTQKYHEN